MINLIQNKIKTNQVEYTTYDVIIQFSFIVIFLCHRFRKSRLISPLTPCLLCWRFRRDLLSIFHPDLSRKLVKIGVFIEDCQERGTFVS